MPMPMPTSTPMLPPLPPRRCCLRMRGAQPCLACSRLVPLDHWHWLGTSGLGFCLPVFVHACGLVGGSVGRCAVATGRVGQQRQAPVLALSQVVGWVQVVVMLPVNQQQQQQQRSAGTVMDQQANRLLAQLALQQTMHGGNNAAAGMPPGLQNANSQVQRMGFLPRLSMPAWCASVHAQQDMLEGSADSRPPSNAGLDGHTGHC
jgi:hypothetical protein